MTKHNVSVSVIKRLPRYYRFLGTLQKEKAERISSKELAERLGLTASQIRQDLNCFGGFGQQGYGYNVTELRTQIGNILGLNNKQKIILIGAGNLGKAITTHMEFETKGFVLKAIFDNNPAVIGKKIGDLTVEDISRLDDYCKKENPVAAILCIPKNSAESLANRLIELGIKGFWNFSHFDLSVNNPNIVVENVHLGDSLMTLSYSINEIL